MKSFIVLVAFSLVFIFGNFSSSNTTFGVETAQAASKTFRKRAQRACRKKYGKRLVRTVIKSNNKIVCMIRRRGQKAQPSSFEDAQKYCNKTYAGWASIIAKKRRGKWVCFIKQ